MNSKELLIRDPENFPEQLKLALDLITINEDSNVVGSSAYKIHKYPSDVDVFESVTVDSSRDKALDFYVNQFKNIMQRLIVYSKYVKVNDFKSGIDSRFDISIPDNSTIYQRRKAVVALSNILDIPDTVVVNLYKSASNAENFREELRYLKTIRWTPEEIIKGCTQLIDGKTITLKEALSMNAVTKLDVITWISGRYQSVEAFYNLRYNELGQIKEFNPLGNYVQGLLEDIEHYSSKDNYTPLKVAKRLWSLSRVIECNELTNALNPLMSLSVAALNQIHADAEVLSDLLKQKLSHKEITKVFLELLTFHKRAANHLSGESYHKFQMLINTVFPIWKNWKHSRELQTNKLKVILKNVMNILQSIINKEASKFLSELRRLNITCRNPRFRIVDALNTPSVYTQI